MIKVEAICDMCGRLEQKTLKISNCYIEFKDFISPYVFLLDQTTMVCTECHKLCTEKISELKNKVDCDMKKFIENYSKK